MFLIGLAPPTQVQRWWAAVLSGAGTVLATPSAAACGASGPRRPPSSPSRGWGRAGASTAAGCSRRLLAHAARPGDRTRRPPDHDGRAHDHRPVAAPVTPRPCADAPRSAAAWADLGATPAGGDPRPSRPPRGRLAASRGGEARRPQARALQVGRRGVGRRPHRDAGRDARRQRHGRREGGRPQLAARRTSSSSSTAPATTCFATRTCARCASGRRRALPSAGSSPSAVLLRARALPRAGARGVERRSYPLLRWEDRTFGPAGGPLGGRGGRDAGGVGQRGGLVGLLPGEVVVVAAEVAVGGGLLVDRAVQVELLAEGARAQVEVLVDELGDLARGRSSRCRMSRP